MVPRQRSTFAGKILERIERLSTDQIETFLGRMVREKEFLEAVFNALTEGVVVCDGRERIVYANDAGKMMLGLPEPTSRKGEPLSRFLRHPELKTLAVDFFQHGVPVRQRGVEVGSTKKRFLSVSIVPVRDEKGMQTHSVWIVADNTEMQQRLDEAQESRRLESLMTLTAGVAHEIKNPLNSMNIHAQLLSRGLERSPGTITAEDIGRMKHSSGVILEEISRLTGIVNQFIGAVRPVRPDLRKTNVNELLVSVAELIGPECQERGISLIVEPDNDLPKLLLDPEQMRQALLNLAKNAVEAVTPENAPPVEDPRIVLRSFLKSDHALLEVADNGVGIAEENHRRIFEPYHTTKITGTGLGLMVVNRIARAHRGVIGLTSRPGLGTVFHLALPLDERPVRLLEGAIEVPADSLTTMELEGEPGPADGGMAGVP